MIHLRKGKYSHTGQFTKSWETTNSLQLPNTAAQIRSLTGMWQIGKLLFHHRNTIFSERQRWVPAGRPLGNSPQSTSLLGVIASLLCITDFTQCPLLPLLPPSCSPLQIPLYLLSKPKVSLMRQFFTAGWRNSPNEHIYPKWREKGDNSGRGDRENSKGPRKGNLETKAELGQESALDPSDWSTDLPLTSAKQGVKLEMFQVPF